MDLFLYFFEHAIYFSVASIPLILVYLQLITFKLPLKVITTCLCFNFIASLFFWFKLKDIFLALYQSVPYVLGFIVLWSANVFRKRFGSNKLEDVLQKKGD